MQVEILWGLPVDLSQEIQKLLGAVTLSDATNHLARQNIECSVQAGCSMTLVIVCVALNLPWPEL